MPTPPKQLYDLFSDRDYNVPIVQPPVSKYKNDIVNANVVEAEANPKGALLQFAKDLPKIYGTDLVRIESRGSIDPARTIAVKSARPAKIKGGGGGFGRFLSNLLGQRGAYRPSDTIFPMDGQSPPVSSNGQPINGDWSGLKNAVEEDTPYVDIARHALVFKQPGSNPLTGLLQGNNPKEMAQQAVGRAIGAAQDLVTKGLVNVLTSKRKGNRNKNTSTFEQDIKKLQFDKKHKGGKYFKTLDANGKDIILKSFVDAKISNWDTLNNDI